MSDTPNLGLPLLAAAQAQKHVTMNEALQRLDSLASPSVKSASLTTPPPAAVEGDAFLVAGPATDLWTGHVGEMAFFVNGGWSFAEPKTGWRLWIADEGRESVFIDGQWTANLVGAYTNGAFASMETATADVELTEDNINITDALIPSHSTVHCVTARVIEELTGTDLTTWRIGVFGDVRRYGSQIGVVKDSTCIGLSGSPLAYYEDTVLRIAPDSGLFSGGVIRLAVHYMKFQPADAV